MSQAGPAQLGLPFESTLRLAHGEEREPKDTSLIVATWNINSIRAHLELVVGWIKRTRPDVLCLQETKVSDDLFPHEVFSQLGYHIAIHGQQQRNGVAILSRVRLVNIHAGLGQDLEDQARAISASIMGIRVASIYAPNAYSIEDPSFASKMTWLRNLAGYVHGQREQHQHLLLCGDFNVAPRESDVHDSSLWLYRTFVHPDVRNALARVVADGLTDLHLKANGDVISYTWWDYRNDAVLQNKGLRIDHIYASDTLAACCTGVFVDVEARRSQKPSDHAPVVARFNLDGLPGRESPR
jgi:exodeoxyribonuclease III